MLLPERKSPGLPCRLPHDSMTETRFPDGFGHRTPRWPSAQTLPCPPSVLQETFSAVIRALPPAVVSLQVHVTSGDFSVPWMTLQPPAPRCPVFRFSAGTFPSASFRPAAPDVKVCSSALRPQPQKVPTLASSPLPPCTVVAPKPQPCPFTPPLHPAPFGALLAAPPPSCC